MKALFKALLIGLLVVYALSYAGDHLWPVHVHWNGGDFESFSVVAALVTVFAVLVWLLFLLFVGTLSLLVVLPLIVLGIPVLIVCLPLIVLTGVFWPWVLGAVVLYLLVKDNRKVRYERY